MLLSIVIPVYNSEPFVLECLDSIIYQLTQETEVIIVDDASSDNSLSLVKKYLESLDYSIKKLIHVISLKENHGVGFARKVAIEKSVGEYIASIDPDDLISEMYVKDILKIIENSTPDILQFQISRFYKDKKDKHIISSHFLEEGFHHIDGNIRKKFYEQSFWSFCTRIIRRELFADIDFSLLRNCEDVYALPLMLLKAKTIYILDNDYYYYRLNNESLSKSIRNLDNVIISYNFILNEYIKLLSENRILYFAIIPIVRGYIGYCLDHKGYRYAESEWLKAKRKIDSNILYKNKFNKITHTMFVRFGVKSLYLFKLVGK